MDSNITRQAKKSKVLSNNQFIRQMNRIDTASMPKRYMNVEPIFYCMLLTQAYFDLKELKNETNIKYAMAILLFASYKLMKYFDLVFNATDNVKGSNYHLCLITLDNELPKLIGAFNYIMFDISDQINVIHIRNSLRKITKAVAELAITLEIDTKHLLYLSVEYFKEIIPVLKQHKRGYLATRVKEIRSLYMNVHGNTKVSTINSLLKQKFEEILE